MELLVATGNKGKFKEIEAYFKTQVPYTLLSLHDLDVTIEEPEEIGDTLVDNAILKAKYYAEKSGKFAIADDSGLFIEALDGWPGVRSARVANSDQTRNKYVLNEMEGLPKEKRKALFKAAVACYNPVTKEIFVGQGETALEITEEEVNGEHGFGYDPILYVPELGKTYAEMTTQEKNDHSHRGKALTKIKYFLYNQYGAKQFICPVALIIKDGKLLMNLRNDPHNPDVHNTWEFPGGGMEFGEMIEENIARETKEETGYDIEIVERLPYIHVEPVTKRHGQIRYQLYILPHVCKIIGGDGIFNDEEVLEAKWFDIDDVLNQNLIGNNTTLFNNVLPALKRAITHHNL